MQRFFSFNGVIVFSILILIASILPLKSSTEVIPFLDKIIHGLIYALLSFVSSNALHLKNHPKARFLGFSYAFSFGIFMEVLQFFIPYRSFDTADIFANLLGSALGVLLKVV